MNKNVGKADQAVRFILGLLIIALGIYYHSWLALVGLIPIATALVSWCPLYQMLGISSCKSR